MEKQRDACVEHEKSKPDTRHADDGFRRRHRVSESILEGRRSEGSAAFSRQFLSVTKPEYCPAIRVLALGFQEPSSCWTRSSGHCEPNYSSPATKIRVPPHLLVCEAEQKTKQKAEPRLPSQEP